MTFNMKKKILSFISILLTVLCCINLGNIIVVDRSISLILLSIINSAPFFQL